ncbi:hypothetical protein Nepgr_028997 [Nepenthes gracilis]|uniref:Uncharacterized protein n=1 Tax=Nepenthes gracilis TaxID=150966 RepID=A0AAD3TDY8_NEPGR|nr:hypothetical protein Nepgr_028997 [Nepenthes gracilis]
MNRSFRAQESLMPSIRPRVPQLKSVKASTVKEKEDDLALFLEMRKREKERNDLLLLQSSEELDESFGLQPGSSPLFNIASATPARKTGADDFLNSDNGKNDYDWLLTPPGTPLFPSLEMESRKPYLSETEAPKARPTVLKSRLANSQTEKAARSSSVTRQPASSPGLSSSSAGIRRPSSAGGPGSRPATPTSRPTLTGSSKPMRSSTPTSRPILPSAKPTVQTSSAKPTTLLTSTRSTASMASTKTSAPSRSSTPSRSTARSSTPTPIPTSRSTSRASTPTRRPSTPTAANASVPAAKSSSSVNKSGSASLGPAAPSRNPVPSRGTSPTTRSRPWKPSEMPGFSLDVPPNLRTSLPERPLSASRGRPGVPAARSASVDPAANERYRRQSCSPSRGRISNGISHNSGGSVPAVSRGHSRVNDDVSPVVIGTKMVERVINMRKLAPPRQDDKHSPGLSGKSSLSPDSSGFGRTLSKKSLDMAIRHMDIRRRIPGNLRPLMANVPASSMYSVRSGPSRSRTVSVSDSPLATSSNASSELSINNNNAGCVDGSEVEDDRVSERGGRAASPVSIHGSS